MRRLLLRSFAILAIVLVSVMYLEAQDPQEQGPPPDQAQNQEQGPPPSQEQGAPQQPQSAVGRISLIEGNLSTLRGDSGNWVVDTVNTPVVPGDQLSAGSHSRAEVQLDYANVLRLDHDSEVRVADLAQGRVQVQVAQGQVDFDVIRDGGAAPEIDTPSVAIHPAGRGAYRIEVNANNQTTVTVREGSAQVSTPQGSTNVQKGQTITIQGADNPEYKIAEARGRDDWDHWNAERDKTTLSAKSWDHTDPYYTGSADLDNNGTWQNVPGYGDVWQPQQAPGWAPYSNGSWVWEPDWGWTWVSNEPWGWAPYHYGRWFYNNSAWCWWPGPVGFTWGFGGWYHPIWAPAYVSFFGFGWGHFGFGFGFGFGGGWGWGRVGWLPVGPRDPFYPFWGHGGAFHPVNVANAANLHNFNNGVIRPLAGAYRPAFGSNLDRALSDPGVRAGVTTVAGNRFGQGPVRGEAGAVTADMLRNSSMMSGRMPLAPTQASLSATGRPAASSTMRGSAMSTHFAGTQAPSFNHASFAQQSAAIREDARNLGASTVAQQSRASAETMNHGAASNGTGSFGQSANTRSNTAYFGRQNAPQSGPATSGWERFASQGGAHGTASSNATTGARTGSQQFGAPPRSTPQSGSSSAQQGWQRFSSQPAPRSSSTSTGRSQPTSGYGSAPSSRYYTGQARPTPGYYTGGARNYGSSRPPLQMSRPMFSPRTAPDNGGGYGQPSGGYSAPHTSGGYSGGRSGGYSGGHASGGGGFHGGGSGGGGHHR
jgi:FecR protein